MPKIWKKLSSTLASLFNMVPSFIIIIIIIIIIPKNKWQKIIIIRHHIVGGNMGTNKLDILSMWELRTEQN